MKTPAPFVAGPETAQSFLDPERAYARVCEIYAANTAYLRHAFAAYAKGGGTCPRARGCYPYVGIETVKGPAVDSRLSYGFVSRPGRYRTTLTRPDLFHAYYLDQFALLLKNHPDCKIEVGVSDTPIPLHFALGEMFHLEGDLTAGQIACLPEAFDRPELENMDDSIPNGTHVPGTGEAWPLALFTAPRIDLSLQRLKHYTGTTAQHFQKYVIFTNYQFYVDEFARTGLRMMKGGDRNGYTAFVEPGDVMTAAGGGTEGSGPTRMPQMPAYHLKRADGRGITLVNIGIGPSNAKTITDHIAVLRSHAWLMLGHCAGLRNSQAMGDYVLAHGYVRNDNVLDSAVPPWVPIPALSEIQIALERSVSDVTGQKDYDLKKIMRTGTVATVSDRNWELWDQNLNVRRLSQSRAIALDMESATVAANGFRFRVPYGTLLCVSDRPLHGQLKLPGMADKFYRDRVDQHLKIGLLAMERLRSMGTGRLHSRKLRSFFEVAFQ